MRGSLVDALGRIVPRTPEPRRILALVPSVTRCLFDLGVGERVVGRTDYCVAPEEEVAALPTVGGPQTVSVEKVLSLWPDLVLADAEENQRDQVDALVKHGMRVYVALPRSLGHVEQFLRDLGSLVNRQSLTDRWAEELSASGQPPILPSVPVACLVWQNPYIAASDATLPHAILTAAGGSNVLAGAARRYPEISRAELARARPRVVLLPDDPYEFTAADAAVVEGSVSGATAVRIPGEWVAWYGSRMGDSIRSLAQTLQPFR